MKKWYSFCASDPSIECMLYDLNSQVSLPSVKLQQVAAEIDEPSQSEKLQQVVAELSFPGVFSYVPWGHHVEIIAKCKSTEEALFYIKQTIEKGLSRSALIDSIKADLYHNEGTALTNFTDRLSVTQAKLAQAIVKDTYDLSFITLPTGYDERALEEALEQNITSFLLELGMGFAFVGRQKEIIVSGKTRKIDMLFYHIHLRCYVVVESKAAAFEPEFAGKLNFYVNAVDELVKGPDDNPTV